MFIVDAHQNIAYNAQQFNRDYTQWAWVTRRHEVEHDVPPAITSLRDNMLGRVGIVLASLKVVPQATPHKKAWEHITYTTAREAYEQAMSQMDTYKRLADSNPNIRLIRTQSDLDTVVSSWADDKEFADHIQGIMPAIEGADPILEPKQFEEWLEHGVRIVAPAWHQTRYAVGAQFDGELTLLGYELLNILAHYNAVLDVSHLSERGFKQALSAYDGTVIASHANPRYFHDTPRSLSDDMIHRLADRDGVMGIMVYNRYLRRDWHPTDPKRRVTLDHVVDAIDYVCQLTGSVNYVGIGSDIDAGYAYSALPHGMDTSTELWELKDYLLARGFADTDVRAILGGNMLRKLRETLPHG